ncbi:hypothetical protein ASF66_20775 [Pseudomonas sp. Leaf129]|nr:hypothetical protein ASF66_20775 [Pseudomonas sp. Leaf129]
MNCVDVAVCLKGRIQTLNGLADDSAAALLSYFKHSDDSDLCALEQWPDSLRTQGFCGVLAARFDQRDQGWVMWFRPEQVETVRWGGKPEKIVVHGLSGPRLSPRGSFEAWEDMVRGHCAPWSSTDRIIAANLRQSLVNVVLHRVSHTDAMRQLLIAVLGHDLRTPLQAITMAASMLSSDERRTATLRQAITTSTGRMSRLVNHVMELSRLQAGLGMELVPAPTDLSALMEALATEAEFAYPGLHLARDIAPGVTAVVDADRISQLLINLISNASQHGEDNHARLILRSSPETVVLEVANPAPPMAPERLKDISMPFKNTIHHQGNRDGLGLGLYISNAIARAHGCELLVEQSAGEVKFRIEIQTSNGHVPTG